MRLGDSALKVAAMIGVGSLFGPLTAPGNVDLKPGKYALTITYDVQGVRQNESRTTTRCVTPGDLDKPERIFNDRIAAGPEEACFVKDLKIAGGTISYGAECPNRLVHVEGNLSGTGFSVVRTVRAKGSQAVALKLTVQGKRKGDCS